MTDDQLHGLAGAYAVDAVDDTDRARFEQHLAVCPECREEVASLRSAAADLGHLVASAPPAGLRDAVLQGISGVRPLPPVDAGPVDARPAGEAARPAPPAEAPAKAPAEAPAGGSVVALADRRRRRVQAWLAGAAAAAVLLVAGLVWQPWSDRTLSPTDQVLQAADASRFPQNVAGGTATIVRSASLGRAVLVAERLPALPSDKVYELWLQHDDGTMAPAGLVPKAGTDRVVVPLEGDARAAVGAGITVEPAGGSPEPTGAPLVLVTWT